MTKYWPYDETHFEALPEKSGAYRIVTPWLITTIEVAPQSAEDLALQNISQHRDNPSPQLMPVLSQILSQLSQYPIAYQLPRMSESFGTDSHYASHTLKSETPEVLATYLLLDTPGALPTAWTWDHEAALNFAQCGPQIYDPLSLLTIARRFHYMDCAENLIGKLYKKIQSLPDAKDQQAASAIVVRQNHFVTERCQLALQPALTTAQSQAPLIQSFMEEEKGHDVILAKGLEAMGLNPEQVPLTPSVQNLMQSFQNVALNNFFGFCLCLDFFEKPEFKSTDSLSEVLTAIHQTTAARALQAHKNINDHGEHEGFSRKLLHNMKPVDPAYALQALRMAELVSFYISHIPIDLHEMIFPD